MITDKPTRVMETPTTDESKYVRTETWTWGQTEPVIDYIPTEQIRVQYLKCFSEEEIEDAYIESRANETRGMI